MTNSPIHILITNDDGVSAPGICTLAQVLRQIAKVTVIAPERNWSASGHVKTMHKPLRIFDSNLADGSPAMVTNGAPSDAIALGLMGIVEDVDLVISGINSGENVGHDLTYSGTVTAAMEGIIFGVPALAVSLYSHRQDADYQPAAAFALQLAQQVLDKGLPSKTLLNVNVPDLPADEIKGVQVTRMGQRVYRDVLIKREDPLGRPYYWIGGEVPTGQAIEGTDFGALHDGYISVTPIQLDFTAHEYLTELAAWPLQVPTQGADA